MSEYKIVIIPDEERLTLDSLTSFEIASILSHRISQIGKDMIVYLPDEYRYVNTDTLEPNIKKKIPQSDVIKNGNGTFVKLSSTADIVAGEINTNNIPYSIYRQISIDHKEKIIYAEMIDPNTLSKPVIDYFANYSV
jgi:hypothetical protein